MKKRLIKLLLSAVGVATVGMAGVVVGKMKEGKLTEQQRECAQKHLMIMQVYNEWLGAKQKGKSLVDYLLKNNVKTVAIYGYGYLGERLYEELKNSEIEMKYVIDQNGDKIYADIDVYKPGEELEKVDLIIVTAVYFYEQIEETLRKEYNCNIVSLEDIVYEL